MIITQTEIMALAFLAGLVLATVVVMLTLAILDAKPSRPKNLKKRAKEDAEFIMNNYYNSASEILRQTTRNQFGNWNNR